MSAATKEKPTKISPRGLGKGLSALMSESYGQAGKTPERSSDAPPREGAVVTLSLDDVRPGKYQPRDHFDQAALQELAESIRRNGVVQPILVRAIAGGKYEIIAGERRWRAAGLASQRNIPAIVRNLDDKKVLEIALIENIQREDLNALEEAKGYHRLMNDFSYTQESLATTVNKSRSHIANLLRLLELSDDIQQLLMENKLSMGHARALLGVPDASFLAQEIIRKNLNVRQAEKLARQGKGMAAPRPRKSKKEEAVSISAAPQNVVPPALQSNAQTASHRDPDILALEETLSENLGLKVSINDRGQSGEIMVTYNSLEQLDDILRRLGGGI